MVPPTYVLVFFFCLLFCDHVLPFSSASGECPYSFRCGNLGELRFPFTTQKSKGCGILAIQGCEDSTPNATKTVTFSGRQFEVRSIDTLLNIVLVRDITLLNLLGNSSCEAFNHNITVPPSSALGYFQISNNITVYKCNSRVKGSSSIPKQFLNYTGCTKSKNETIYFGTQNQDDPPPYLKACPSGLFPANSLPFSGDPFTFIAFDFPLLIRLPEDCYRCTIIDKGLCRLNSTGGFYCFQSQEHKSWYSEKKEDKSWTWKLGLIIALGVGGIWVLVLTLVLCFRHYQQKYAISHVRLRSTTHYPNVPDPDPDSGRLFFGVPIFSYKELQDATNNFDPSNKLGDGGFGSVYYGRLQDGREVAVKHLFNHTYKRIEQFITEVEILTRLRHRNLVSLYGCTSHLSRELLLVYEYIPNGTVASHLRGLSAKPASLTWPLRIKIAIETASALAYLHSSGIIHRDVKTNNILLDDNFCVKVADFGLSRLFPDDVSHVSTAPQGTPGYLDPEYHFCFRLTNKSDVYSFGVVLMELISSMPAVDLQRNKDEITLGSLAVRKMQRSEFDELVDPCLGIEMDSEVKRKVVAVGELAFQCLQTDKEVRPSIDEVLEVLRKIESGEEESEDAGEDGDSGGGGGSESKADKHPRQVASLNLDQARLFKKMKSSSSPNSVTAKWRSESTTPNYRV